MKNGHFVISLDFELFWGMADKYTLREYGSNVLGERTAIPRMLDLFTQYGIHATWATVGMLMTRNRDELLSLLPPQDLRPKYDDPRMSTYYYLEHTRIGKDETDDPYHYGPSLVEMVLATPHQELANHTFSHYYAIDGNDLEKTLAQDLDLHARISRTYGVATTSIVFPRNQCNEAALPILRAKGITAYRGNENHALYRSRKDNEQTLPLRGVRLLDHYLPLSGHHTYALPHSTGNPVNVPASRFFRPYMPPLRFFETLRLRRIKNSMTHAAKKGEVFHLWWHPHNLGIHQEENFRNLISILEHFRMLEDTYGFTSASMREIATASSV